MIIKFVGDLFARQATNCFLKLHAKCNIIAIFVFNFMNPKYHSDFLNKNLSILPNIAYLEDITIDPRPAPTFSNNFSSFPPINPKAFFIPSNSPVETTGPPDTVVER